MYKDRSQVKEGYFASTDIFFKISDLEQYKSLWMGLSGLENVAVESVQYDHSRRIEFQNETRQKALLVAREKAAALAATLGAKSGEPLKIAQDSSLQEYFSASRYSNSISMSEDDLNKSESIAPGKIPIRMTMGATFRLKSE